MLITDEWREGGRKEGKMDRRKEGGIEFYSIFVFSSVFHRIDRLHISTIIKAESAKTICY
jgi:hypothetical protein